MLAFDKTLSHTFSITNNNIASKDNRLVVGDNLDSLHNLVLQGGVADLICTDPPYNTRKNAFAYADNRETSQWVSFLWHRLVLARKVLSPQGVIVVNIDDAHHPYLKLLMDEVFGSKNFVANFIWKKSHTVKNDSKGISTQHEHILCGYY